MLAKVIPGPCGRAHVNEYGRLVAGSKRWFCSDDLIRAVIDGNCQISRTSQLAGEMAGQLKREGLIRIVRAKEQRQRGLAKFVRGHYESLCVGALQVVAPLQVLRPETIPPSVWREPPIPSELRVAGLMAQGLSNAEIAAQLSLEIGSVKAVVHQVLQKSGCASRQKFMDAVRRAQLALSLDSIAEASASLGAPITIFR